MLRIIQLLLAVVLGAFFFCFSWFKDTWYSVKKDKRNIPKLICVPIICFYLVTRAFGFVEIYIKKDTRQYTLQDMTERRLEKAERLIDLQSKTYFLDRYKNIISFLKEDDRPFLANTFHLMTYSRRFYKYSDIVWSSHLKRLVKEQNEEKLEDYKKHVKWMSDNELTRNINRYKE